MAEAHLLPTARAALNIALLSAGYPPASFEGVARSTWILARGLAELGQDVHVVASGDRDSSAVEEGVHVHRLAPVSLSYGLVRDAGCHNLHAWLNHSHRVHSVLLHLSGGKRLDVVDTPLWHLDGLVTAVSRTLPVVVRVVTAVKQIADLHWQPALEGRILGELEERLLEMSAGIVSNSTASVSALGRVYGIDPAGKVHGLVSYGLVPTSGEYVQPLEARHKADPIVLFVGRLETRKGILDLFEAIPEVRKAVPGVRFWLAGSDNSAHDGFQPREGLSYPAHFARQHPDLVDSVKFLGFVPERELPDLYRACDLFVAPSIYESFGLIYLEAMDQARPVVGCSGSGSAEVIAGGETGLLVPPADPARLAQAIIRLLEDPASRREMGIAGRKRLLERFTHTRMAAGFLDVYRRVVGGR